MIKNTLFRKLLSFTILAYFLAACSSGPEGYLKRSANNKIFDRKGFKGGKRAPLYNKKYVAKAKKNVMNNEYDENDEEDYDDESENVSRENIEMYKMMIEEDLQNNPNNSRKKSRRKNPRSHNTYPSIVKASNKINYDDSHSNNSNSELRDEIDQIKSMLEDAKRDLSSYKCPTAKSIEKQYEKKQDDNIYDNFAPTNEPQSIDDLEQDSLQKNNSNDLNNLDDSIIEPVTSI